MSSTRDLVQNPGHSGAEPALADRRRFLEAAALAGLSAGLVACGKQPDGGEGRAAGGTTPGQQSHEVGPGQLDEYYGMYSGGHSGEVRIVGIPSGREIRRIPVFNPDAMSGWGHTNESRRILGTRPDGRLRYTTGDTHHVHGSYSDGTYDGKYFWVNDKLHSRLARIRGDTMECDAITELPNVQGFHGLFPDKRDPLDPALNRTTRVFCGAEFAIPQPNDGSNLDDTGAYSALFTCVDAESM